MPSTGSICSQAMATLTVLACSFFTAGQTLGSMAGQALELFTWAPSTRNGAPSTMSAERPSRVTISGMGAAAAATRERQCETQEDGFSKAHAYPLAASLAFARIAAPPHHPGLATQAGGSRMNGVSWRGFLCASALILSSASIAAGTESTARKDVLKIAARVADWQLERMGATHGVTKYAEETANPRSWQQGAFWVGMTRLADVTGEKRFADAIISMGKANQWQPGKRTYHADDHVIAQSYLWAARHGAGPKPSHRCAPRSIRSSPSRRSIT